MGFESTVPAVHVVLPTQVLGLKKADKDVLRLLINLILSSIHYSTLKQKTPHTSGILRFLSNSRPKSKSKEAASSYLCLEFPAWSTH